MDFGADALGFNTWQGTKRYLNLEEARPWLEELPSHVLRVALLVNAESSGSGSIAVSSGGVQSANANTTFANPLTVIVKDASNNPLSGATVTFKVPAIGASATLSSGTAITNSSGIARINATANATVGGPYIVSATIAGVATAATFLLSNTGLSATMTPSSLTIVSPVSPPAR